MESSRRSWSSQPRRSWRTDQRRPFRRDLATGAVQDRDRLDVHRRELVVGEEGDGAVVADPRDRVPGAEPPAPGLRALAAVDGEELLCLGGCDNDRLAAERRGPLHAVLELRPGLRAPRGGGERNPSFGTADAQAAAAELHGDALRRPPRQRRIRLACSEGRRKGPRGNAARLHCTNAGHCAEAEERGEHAEDDRLPHRRSPRVLSGRQVSRRPQMLGTRHFLSEFSLLRVGTGASRQV